MAQSESNNIVNEQWKIWNSQGLIPGDEELEEDYRKRVEFCLNLMDHLRNKVAELPFSVNDLASKGILEAALIQDSYLFGISPTWIPIFFNNHQLTFWQGGCAWIFQLDEHTPTSAFVQLRLSFKNQSSYLGFYSRNEILSHELAHVGRMMYHEPQFEEILAYQTSTSKWRRFLSPVFESRKESLLFILLIGLFFLNHIITVTLEQSSNYLWSFGFGICIFGLIAFALIRLNLRHCQFNRCLEKLENLYENKEIASHLIYRLKDSEIKLFAKSSLEEIDAYRQSNQNFRWKFLNNLYP